jgi:alkanesulfonate monooxygenase SsuD/methylene tetrahydromethanopterin reductase-like flavin-dependent oxidoreductase (luciferase family)
MKFGLFNLMSIRDNPAGVAGVIDDTRVMIRIAEDIGFDVAWFAEHHFTNYSASPSPLMMAAHFAGTTSRIRVGAAVIVLPLYHPMRVAQEIALVDQLSGGRLVLGVGSGYQAYEFDRLGADVARKTDIFLEYWTIVEQALTTGRAEFRGEFITIPPSVFSLAPLQTPMPELYVTSLDPRVLKQLAKHNAIPFITAGWRGSPALGRMAANAQSMWDKAGLTDRPMPIGVQQYIHVTDSRSEALEAAERARFVARMVAALRHPNLTLDGAHLDAPPLDEEPPLEVFRDNLIIGDAHHVAQRLIAEITALRPVHYNCFFQFGDMPIARAARSLERFGAEVLPLVEAALGPLDQFGCARPAVAAVA